MHTLNHPPYSQEAPEDTHWPPASHWGRSRCHWSKAAFAEAPVLSPEAPPFLLLPLRLGEAAQIAAAPEPLCAQGPPGGPPAPRPAPPSPAGPPALLPAAGLRGCALLGESRVLWAVPASLLVRLCHGGGRVGSKSRVRGRVPRTSQASRAPDLPKRTPLHPDEHRILREPESRCPRHQGCRPASSQCLRPRTEPNQLKPR